MHCPWMDQYISNDAFHLEKQKDRKYKQFSQHIKGNKIWLGIFTTDFWNFFLEISGCILTEVN